MDGMNVRTSRQMGSIHRCLKDACISCGSARRHLPNLQLLLFVIYTENLGNGQGRTLQGGARKRQHSAGWIAVRASARGTLNRSIKAKQKRGKRSQSVILWITMAGPNSSVVYPAELVEIITVGVVKIMNWREYDGGRAGSRKAHVREGRRSNYQRGMNVSGT